MTKLTKMDRMVMVEVNKACENMENYADVYMAIDPVGQSRRYMAAFNRYADVIQTAIDMKIAG